MIWFRIVPLFLSAVILTVSSGWCHPIYSSNGLGMFIPDDAGRSMGMGGAGIANDDGMNLLRDNPALLSSFISHTFSIGLSYNAHIPQTGDIETPTWAKITPNLLKIVLPIAKGVVFGWGLSPYTKNDSVIETPMEMYTEKITSRGGINVSSVGIAGSYKDIIRLGVSLNYNFGMIHEEWARTFPNNDELHGITNYINKKYKGYSTTVGLLARLFDNTRIGVGYTSKSDMNLSIHVIPEDFYNPEQVYQRKTEYLPSSWRFGITSSFSDQMTSSMDISFYQWEKAACTLKQKEMYNDSYRFGAGVRYNPSQNLDMPFYKKFPLSLGFKFGTLYYKSYPKVETVFEKALTCGIEIPFKEDMASIITSFELGTRGDESKNGWSETFANIGIIVFGRIK